MKQLATFSLIVFLLLPITAQNMEPVQLKANATRVNLTPPLELKYSLGGYGARMSKPAIGIHDRIWVKALVISDDQKKYAIITMDMLALPPNIKPQVLEALGKSGWVIHNMMILPSHSHTTLDMSAINDKNILNNPYIGIYQPKLREFVINAIVKAVKQADKDLKSVKIATSRKRLDKLNRNRRGDTAIDRDLTVTRIDLADGKPLVVLVNWTAHPTIMSDEDMYVSGGWPGYLQRELEAWIGNDVIAMYYNGAEGDQSVISSKAGSHYEQAEIYGRTIAKKTFELYQKIEPVTKTIFSYRSIMASLPEPQMHAQFMNTGGTEYGIDKQTERIILDVMCPAKTNITALRLGDLLIVGAPGEMAYVLGDRIKSQLMDKGACYPVIGGIANEWISYILTKEQYNNAGYEASVSFYGPELGPTISQAMIEAASPLIK